MSLRKRFIELLAAASILVLAGCGNGKETEAELPEVKLSVWASGASRGLVIESMEEFKQLHKDEVKLEYTVSVEEEDTCKTTVLSDPKAAADIFCFPDDQLQELYMAGALLEISEDKDAIIDSVGGPDSGAARVAMRDGKLMACPMSAGNGYFLYYNRDYLTEEDVKSLDRILEVARDNGKYFTMDLGSGWYIYSFFKGAGLTMERSPEEDCNICNWNSTDMPYTGVMVTECMLKMATDPGFKDLGDEGFQEAVASGEVIAGINGAWNAEKVSSAWGRAYSAAKLPVCTINGDEVQMASFMGYKLMGVNANTSSPEWAVKAAEYLTSEEAQLKRFKKIGDCPVNLNAAQREEVQAAPAVAALTEQSEFGYAQNVADPFWSASQIFGITISGGNADGRDLQELLDEMTAGITEKQD